MFCPSCGLEDTQSNQYCRSCGTDIRSVQTVLKNPRTISGSGKGARAEIGRALAAKIQSTESSSELSDFAHKILPKVEKFLESPKEKRMRRIRNGSIVSFAGLGASVGFFLASIFGGDPEIVIMSAFGFVAFCVGMALVVNGMFFTTSKNSLAESPLEEIPKGNLFSKSSATNELLMPPPAEHEFVSVTEPTTRHLKKKDPVLRDE